MPEEYFVKDRSGRYRSIGTAAPEVLYDGLYFHQKQRTGSRTTSIQHWVGADPKQPVDVLRLVDIMKNDEDVANYLMRLQDGNSEEFKKLKRDSHGWVKDPLRIFNISMSDLAQAILRFLYEKEQERLNASRKSERDSL